MDVAVATLSDPTLPSSGRKATSSQAASVAGLHPRSSCPTTRQVDVGRLELVQRRGAVGQLEADDAVARRPGGVDGRERWSRCGGR